MMNEIVFKKVILTNFRGQNREVVFNDHITQIIGFNGTGKTSVFAAVKWCLTGTDEANRTNYDLFDNTLDFTHENAAPTIVELVSENAGVTVVFKRQATQKWIRPRGSAEYVKDKSDEYKFFIDGLELSATAYKERVAGLFGMDVEKLKLCMDVRYYQMLEWKELRKHFSDLVDEINDDDLKGDYAAIMPYIDQYKSGDKAKEFFRQQINPLKLQIKNLDADIKASERILPDLAPVIEAEQLISDKKKRITEINKEILGLEEANKPYIEKRNTELAALDVLKQEYVDKKREYETAQSMRVVAIQKELDDAEKHNSDIDKKVKEYEQAVTKHNAEVKLCKEDVEDLQQELERLRAQNKELKQREFSDTICPNCGQELPADQIANLRAKFYDSIDKQREPIVERGKKIAALLEERLARLAKLQEEEITINSIPKRIDTFEIKERIKTATNAIVPFADTDEAKSINQRIEVATAALTIVPDVNSAELQKEIDNLVADIQLLSKITARRETHAKCEEAIAEYQKTKRDVGVELAKWEGLLDKLQNRQREWADIVRNRANENLKYSHVEMVELNKSGELVDTCTLSINGVDRGVTNHANKTIIGIDISNAICKRYNVKIPLFIDDFEHFTEDLTYSGDRQAIVLIADKHYSQLTIC